jgi:hypothetical protein
MNSLAGRAETTLSSQDKTKLFETAPVTSGAENGKELNDAAHNDREVG